MPHTLPPPSAFRSVTFPSKRDDETVLLLLRRHPFVFALTALFALLLAVLPPLLLALVPREWRTALGGTAGEGLLGLALASYELFVWLFFAYAWVDYYLDLWVVTDDRVVNIEQAGLFNRVISEQPLVRVQDATSEVRGLFPTFLDYGNVYVQTAGERERFVFEQVPAPDLVKKVILEAQGAALARAGIGLGTPSSLV